MWPNTIIDAGAFELRSVSCSVSLAYNICYLYVGNDSLYRCHHIAVDLDIILY